MPRTAVFTVVYGQRAGTGSQLHAHSVTLGRIYAVLGLLLLPSVVVIAGVDSVAEDLAQSKGVSGLFLDFDLTSQQTLIVPFFLLSERFPITRRILNMLGFAFMMIIIPVLIL